MTLVSIGGMLNHAKNNGYAVGQFNLYNLEFTQAILTAAQKEQAPVILGVTDGTRRYMGGFKAIVGLVKGLIEEYRVNVPVALHLDHGSSFELCVQAMEAGFSSVMIDASHLPLDENIFLTKQVVEAARAAEVSVEAEIGRIGGQEDSFSMKGEVAYANADDCERLVRETGVTCLAPALGSIHGPYRDEPKLRFDLMKNIAERTQVPLVLHGGSGIPSEEIRKAILHGTAKINVYTENQIAATKAVREALNRDPSAYDPRFYWEPAREAVKAVVKTKIREFGCNGKGSSF